MQTYFLITVRAKTELIVELGDEQLVVFTFGRLLSLPKLLAVRKHAVFSDNIFRWAMNPFISVTLSKQTLQGR